MQKTTFIIQNWAAITEKTATLFFAESEKRLQETVSTFNIWTDKAFRLLTILIPSIVLLTGYIFSGNFCPEKYPAAVFIGISVCSIYLVISSISSQVLQPTGTMPSNLFKEETIFQDTNGSQYIGWVINLCENIQSKIDHNNHVNEKRSRDITWALKLSGLVAPVASFVAALIVYLVYHH